MLNLLKKTTPWMVASLFVATSVFGQDNGSAPKASAQKSEPASPKSCKPECAPKPKSCPAPCPQPCPPTQMCPQPPAPCCPAWPQPVLNAAYNYPARVQTRCPWDINFDVSFIYWQPIQENLEIGVVGPDDSAVFSNMDFNYKPGFKIGGGYNFDYDGWDLHGEYTWFHTKNSSSASGEIFPLWGSPGFHTDDTYTSASASWTMNMDLAELDLGRWYYVGTKLTVRPNFGVRAAWIRETYAVDYTTVATDAITSRSHSWAVGLKTGLESNWVIGSGFRMYTSGEADLLFTKYTRLSTKHTKTDDVFSAKQRQVYAVKPHVDLELGFGWGTYLDCNNWYMDFALGYGFQVFFDQNMFRHFVDDTKVMYSNVPNGNLYVQGLTATFALDF